MKRLRASYFSTSIDVFRTQKHSHIPAISRTELETRRRCSVLGLERFPYVSFVNSSNVLDTSSCISTALLAGGSAFSFYSLVSCLLVKPLANRSAGQIPTHIQKQIRFFFPFHIPYKFVLVFVSSLCLVLVPSLHLAAVI